MGELEAVGKNQVWLTSVKCGSRGCLLGGPVLASSCRAPPHEAQGLWDQGNVDTERSPIRQQVRLDLTPWNPCQSDPSPLLGPKEASPWVLFHKGSAAPWHNALRPKCWMAKVRWSAAKGHSGRCELGFPSQCGKEPGGKRREEA